MTALLLLSLMLLPTEGGPGWLLSLSKASPLTHVVDAGRALFAGELAAAAVLDRALAAVAVLIVGLVVGTGAVGAGSA